MKSRRRADQIGALTTAKELFVFARPSSMSFNRDRSTIGRVGRMNVPLAQGVPIVRPQQPPPSRVPDSHRRSYQQANSASKPQHGRRLIP